MVIRDKQVDFLTTKPESDDIYIKILEALEKRNKKEPFMDLEEKKIDRDIDILATKLGNLKKEALEYGI